MKLFFLIFCFLSAFKVFAQDSTLVSEAQQPKNVESADSIPLVFTTKIYLEAIKDDTLEKYFLESKVKKALAATYLFPLADSGNRLWQPIKEAKTHDDGPLSAHIAEARAEKGSWKAYEKSRKRAIGKKKRKEKRGKRKFERKFRKGKTAFNWNRLEEEEAKFEEEQKRLEEEKAEKKQAKKDARKARKEARKQRKAARKNKNVAEVKEEEKPFWMEEEDGSKTAEPEPEVGKESDLPKGKKKGKTRKKKSIKKKEKRGKKKGKQQDEGGKKAAKADKPAKKRKRKQSGKDKQKREQQDPKENSEGE